MTGNEALGTKNENISIHIIQRVFKREKGGSEREKEVGGGRQFSILCQGNLPALQKKNLTSVF